MDNLEEMDRFLEKFHFSRLNQEEIEIMNNPITSTEIEIVTKKKKPNKKTLKTKAQDQMASQENSIKFREELMPNLLKCFQKIAEERTLPNSFYKATITLIPKPNNWQERKLQANILMNIDSKVLNKILAKRIQ